MARSVGTGSLQYGSTIAVDHDRCKWRRIVFKTGVTVTVAMTGMGVVSAGMIMSSRVGDISGNRKGCGYRRTRQQAVTKPRPGFAIPQCHNYPVPEHASPRKAALTPSNCSVVAGAGDPDIPLRSAEYEHCPNPRLPPNNTVKQVRKTRLQNG